MIPEVGTIGDFQLTPDHEVLFKAIEEGNDHIIVNAVAGSGKTSSILKSMEYLPRHARVLFLAFNKHIQKELEQRAPKHVKVQTCHGYGLGALKKNLSPPPEFEEHKLNRLIDELIPDERTRIQRRGTLRRLVSLAKSYVVWDEHEIEEICEDHEIEIKDENSRNAIFQQVSDLLHMSAKDRKSYDFDDMIWLLVVLELEGYRYDRVFIDESQDLNKIQMLMLERVVAAGGRVVIVGDPRQGIYRFRGADAKAMQTLKEKFSAVELPLSVCYRCSKSVVREAQKIVPHIKWCDTAPEGSVQNATLDRFLEEVRPGDMVLCRTSAPLVPVYFKLVRRKIKACIVGRDIGSGLARLVEKFTPADGSLKGLLANLDAYRAREVQRYMASYKPEKAMHIVDQVETIIELGGEAKDALDLQEILRTVFSEDRVGIALSTVHKSKGLEAERVWILRPDLMPHPLAKQEAAVEQEMNLKYVAITRARKDLFWVHSPKDDRQAANRLPRPEEVEPDTEEE